MNGAIEWIVAEGWALLAAYSVLLVAFLHDVALPWLLKVLA